MASEEPIGEKMLRITHENLLLIKNTPIIIEMSTLNVQPRVNIPKFYQRISHLVVFTKNMRTKKKKCWLFSHGSKNVFVINLSRHAGQKKHY